MTITCYVDGWFRIGQLEDDRLVLEEPIPSTARNKETVHVVIGREVREANIVGERELVLLG